MTTSETYVSWFEPGWILTVQLKQKNRNPTIVEYLKALDISIMLILNNNP